VSHEHGLVSLSFYLGKLCRPKVLQNPVPHPDDSSSQALLELPSRPAQSRDATVGSIPWESLTSKAHLEISLQLASCLLEAICVSSEKESSIGGGFGTANGPNQKRASILALISSFAPVFCICLLVWKQVALFGHWLAEAKMPCEYRSTPFPEGQAEHDLRFHRLLQSILTSIIGRPELSGKRELRRSNAFIASASPAWYARAILMSLQRSSAVHY
jgi:hypothetical protein